MLPTRDVVKRGIARLVRPTLELSENCLSRTWTGFQRLVAGSLLFFYSLIVCPALCQEKKIADERKHSDSAGMESADRVAHEQTITIVGTNTTADIDLGEVRNGYKYSCRLTLKNATGESIKPVNSVTSCSCLVSSLDKTEIETGASRKLEIHAIASSKKLQQQAVVEFDRGHRVEININGVFTPDFNLSETAVAINSNFKTNGKSVFLKSMFSDVDLTSVEIGTAFGYLKVIQTKVVGEDIMIGLAEGHMKPSFPAMESIEVSYSTKNLTKRLALSLPLGLTSDAVYVRPKILRAVANETENESSVDYTFFDVDVNFQNLPRASRTKINDKFSIRFADFQIVEAVAMDVQLSKSSVLVKLRFRLPNETATKILEQRDWIPTTLFNDDFSVDGLKCVFIKGED